MARMLFIGSQWVKKSPKTSDVTKGDTFQLILFHSDEKVG